MQEAKEMTAEKANITGSGFIALVNFKYHTANIE